jgi:predicted DNA-binding transcriptional regulator YafY
MNVSISAELKQWLLGFGPEVEVLAPQKLAEEIFETHFEACRKSRPDLFRGMNIK